MTVPDQVASGAVRLTEKPKDPVASLGGQIPTLSTGDRAALRRLVLTGSGAAYGVVIGLMHRAGLPAADWNNDAAFGRWCLLAHFAAVLSGTAAEAPHQPGISLGRTLHTAGYSENRLMRLTTAKGPALPDQINRVARILAAGGHRPVDLRTVLDLSFGTGDRAERARLKIARDYYAAIYANQKDAP